MDNNVDKLIFKKSYKKTSRGIKREKFIFFISQKKLNSDLTKTKLNLSWKITEYQLKLSKNHVLNSFQVFTYVRKSRSISVVAFNFLTIVTVFVYNLCNNLNSYRNVLSNFLSYF